MAKYSRTTLAAIAALQKRRKPPIPVKEKALVSHLYPFKYNEVSNVTSDYAIDRSLQLSADKPDISNVEFIFNMNKFSTVFKLSQEDTYNTNTKLAINVNKISERVVDLGNSSIDIYNTNTKLNISIDKVALTFVDIGEEDSYNTDTVISISVNKV